MLMILFSLQVSAQSVEKLYTQGKELYDAKKYAEAVPKLQAAADKGHKKAQYRLGRCYDKGYGVAESSETAFKWYMKSAAQGYAKAQYRVGKCYKDGDGVAKDKAKAVEYFTRAAKQEYGEAELALGKAYMKGKGIAADAAKAKTWLKRAISNEKDGDQILKELREEAAQGDEDAKAILSITGKK